MADLVRRRVAVIATPPATLLPWRPKRRPRRSRSSSASAKTRSSLVLSPASPGRAETLTGINFFVAELAAKRLALLHELVPKAVRIAVLVNPANAPIYREPRYESYRMPPVPSDCKFRSSMPAPGTRSRRPSPSLAHDRADALFVASDAFFTSRRVQFATLAARHRIPATYPTREAVEAGGLMSYGTDNPYTYRQVGALHWSNSQGREARRPAGRAVDQIRIRHQPANGQGARPRRASNAARARRRGDRMRAPRVHHAARRRGGCVAARGAARSSRRCR